MCVLLNACVQDIIKKVKSELKIPVIANGGIGSRADALAWGSGDTIVALQEMKHAGRANDGPPRLPEEALSA